MVPPGFQKEPPKGVCPQGSTRCPVALWWCTGVKKHKALTKIHREEKSEETLTRPKNKNEVERTITTIWLLQ